MVTIDWDIYQIIEDQITALCLGRLANLTVIVSVGSSHNAVSAHWYPVKTIGIAAILSAHSGRLP